MDPIKNLVRRISKVEKLAFRAATQPQLAHSSVEDGAIRSNLNDQLQMVVGQQFDGTQSVAIVNGPPPPTPTAPITTSALEGITVKWDGLFTNDAIVPMNFARVEVHASTDPDFTAEYAETLIGYFESPRGGTFFASLVPATYYVKFVTRTQSGVRSVPSVASAVTPTPLDESLPPVSDGEGPATSPAVVVSPLGYSGVMLKWAPVANADPVKYRVFFDTVNPPVQQLTETSGLLAATSVLPDGTPLETGTTYYAQIEAFDVDAPAPARGAVGSGGPIVVPADAVAVDILVANELFSREGYFGKVSAEQVETGLLNAALAIVGGLTVGPAGSSGITITPDNGIVIRGAAGDTILPTDGGVISLSGTVTAQSLIATNVSVRDQNNEFATGSTVVLQSGSTPPKAGPQMLSIFPEHASHPAYNPRGQVQMSTLNRYLSTDTIGGASIIYATFLDSNGDYTFAFENYSINSATDGAGRTEVASALGGITTNGNDVYVLCEAEVIPGTYQRKWFVYQFTRNMAWTSANPVSSMYSYVRRWEYVHPTSSHLGGLSTNRPQIGFDGTNIVIAQANVNDNWYVTKWSTTGAFINQTALFQADGTTAFNTARHCSGIVASGADLGLAAGVQRWFIGTETNSGVYSFTTAGVRQLSEEFNVAGGTPWYALRWDGTRFHSMNATKAYDYSQIRNVSALRGVQTWRLRDGTDSVTPLVGDFATYETAASPETVGTGLKNRGYLQIQSPSSIPSGMPDSVSFYLKQGAGTYHIVPPPLAGQLSQLIDVLPTTGIAPSGAYPFPQSAAAVLKSAARDGGGVAIVSADGLGNFRAAKTFQADVVSVPGGSGAQSSAHVNFPVPFDNPPSVVVSPETGVLDSTVKEWGVLNVTATGFDAQVFRTNATSTLIHWQAMKRG
jgi:hypothetical protein